MFRELDGNELAWVSGGEDTRSYKPLPGVLPIDFDLSDWSNQGMQTVTDGFGGDDQGGGNFGIPPQNGPDFSHPSTLQLLLDLIEQFEEDHRDTLILNEGQPNASVVSGIGGSLGDGTSIFVYQDNGSTFAVQVSTDF